LLAALLLIYAAFWLSPVFAELRSGHSTAVNSSAALESLFLPLAVAGIFVSLCCAFSWMRRSATPTARRAVVRRAQRADSPPQPLPRPKTAGSKPAPRSSNADEFTACPNCGKSGSTWGGTETLNIFYCKCGKVYCDQCSGGGAADLPQCPVSADHEKRWKVRSVTASERGPSTPRDRFQVDSGANSKPHSATLMAPSQKANPKPALREIMIFKAGARIRDEIWYIEQVVDYIGYSLKKLAGVHIENIRYVTPDKLEYPYMMAALMKAGYDPCNCKISPFEDRDGGRGLAVEIVA
jgi:hypothetical protein